MIGRALRSTGSFWSLLFVVSLILASCTSAALSRDVLPPGSLWTRVTPNVLWCEDRTSTATIEVHVVDVDDVVSVRVVGPNETFRLYDDGTHGDEVAGDSVFTVNGARPYCSRAFSLKFDKSFSTWYGTVEVTLSDGRVLEDAGWVSIGLVNPSFRQRSDITVLGDGITMTWNTLFIEDPDLAIFGGYPVYSSSIEDAARAVCERLYRVLPDAFDFVVVMPAMSFFSSSEFLAFDSTTIRVSNDVAGIGLSLFDRTAEFASAGRLQSVIVHSFGSVDLVDRELMQRWGAGLGLPLGLTEETDAGSLLWSPLSDIGGQLAAYYVAETGEIGRLADNGDGTWRLLPATGNEPYSPLELYIMGLIPPDEVPPIHLLSGLDVSNPERVTAQSVRTVTIDDIVEADGVRTPPATASPIEFSVAFVVVQDLPFTDAEYAFFTLLSTELTYAADPSDFDLYAPFYWATGERATLKTELPLPLSGDETAADLTAP
jgi:hypothetical protein